MIAALDLPVELESRGGALTVRRATVDDLDAIVALLSDDPVSVARGDWDDGDDHARLADALERILADPGNEQAVVEQGGTVVGILQLTLIPGLARGGTTRLLVEGVRVRSDRRSAGIGGAAMRWVVDTAAPAIGSTLVQLTSDAARPDAHCFYERHGFVRSHVGFTRAI